MRGVRLEGSRFFVEASAYFEIKDPCLMIFIKGHGFFLFSQKEIKKRENIQLMYFPFEYVQFEFLQFMMWHSNFIRKGIYSFS